MTMPLYFPVLSEHTLRVPTNWPKRVPWRLVEPLRGACLRAHNQTLEQLAERGGLSVGELYCHVTGTPFKTAFSGTEEQRIMRNGQYKDFVLDWFMQWAVFDELARVIEAETARDNALTMRDEVMERSERKMKMTGQMIADLVDLLHEVIDRGDFNYTVRDLYRERAQTILQRKP